MPPGLPRLECWFGPANARTDYFIVGGSPELETVAAQANYRILKKSLKVDSGKQSLSLRIEPPDRKTIVQAILEAEGWPGVKYVETEPREVR